MAAQAAFIEGLRITKKRKNWEGKKKPDMGDTPHEKLISQFFKENPIFKMRSSGDRKYKSKNMKPDWLTDSESEDENGLGTESGFFQCIYCAESYNYWKKHEKVCPYAPIDSF